MRLLYFILFFTINYALRVFYPRQRIVNSPKEFFGRTIYVSNHASSFMDPLVVAGLRMPIVFFMTRSDVFTTFMKPILWASHMFPIFRQQDGLDTKLENEKVFRRCTRVLSFGRNLLIFGEGFTDDVFIRRLKPVKKGAVRIGFIALEQLNWKKKIYLAAVGVNYSDPGQMRSDLLVSTSDKICLNDYKEEYLNNPNKVIADLTQQVEKLLQAQITHIENAKFAPFHENVMRITRKGMNAKSRDLSYSLEERWKYSKTLAHWFNENVNEENEGLMKLKGNLESYFKEQADAHIDEKLLVEYKKRNGSVMKERIQLILLFPFMLFGLIHCGLPYILIKRFVEKSFKRRVFWSSVKLLLGMISIGLLNIPMIFLFHNYIFPSYWLGFLYYVMIGFFGVSAYQWFRSLSVLREKKSMKKNVVDYFWQKRVDLEKEIVDIIPIA